MGLFAVIFTKMNTLTGITVTMCALMMVLAVVDARRKPLYSCIGMNCTECITGENMSFSKDCCSLCKLFGM